MSKHSTIKTGYDSFIEQAGNSLFGGASNRLKKGVEYVKNSRAGKFFYNPELDGKFSLYNTQIEGKALKDFKDGLKDTTKGFINSVKGAPCNFKDKSWWKKYWPEVVGLFYGGVMLGANLCYRVDPNYSHWADLGITTAGSLKPFYRKPLSNSSGDLTVENFRDLNPLETDLAQTISVPVVYSVCKTAQYLWDKRKVRRLR